MSKRRLSVEQMINHLGEAEVLLAQSKRVEEICRQIGVLEQSHYGWLWEYGGLRLDRACRLKDLEQENRPVEAGGGRSDAGQAEPQGGR